MVIEETEDNLSERSGDAGSDPGDRPALHPEPAVVGDAEPHTVEQVGALHNGRGTAPERIAHLILTYVHGSPGLSRSLLKPLMPRVRWVFTEFREIPMVSAMSSMPSSS